MAKHWMYHAEKEPKIFETAELAAAEKEGWVDTPAKLPQYEDELTAPERPSLDTPVIKNAGPEPFAELSDDDLRDKLTEVRGKRPHPSAKRQTLIDSLNRAGVFS